MIGYKTNQCISDTMPFVDSYFINLDLFLQSMYKMHNDIPDIFR